MRKTIVQGILWAVLAGTTAVSGSALAADTGSPQLIRLVTQGGAQHKRIVVPLNKTAIVTLDAPAHEIVVGRPGVVDAVIRSPRRVYLIALKVGETNAFFFDKSGRRLAELDIRVDKDGGDLDAMLQKELPDSDITTTMNNGTVILSGKVTTAGDALKAQQIAGQFVGGDAKKVISLLKITSVEQVMLQVRVAEVSRSVTKQLGIDLSKLAGTMATPWGGVSLSGSIIGGLNNNSGLSGTVTANNFTSKIQALENLGLIHTLAEPNLIAVSGETAKFLAGGEFPVASGRDTSGNISITFKQFGVGLSFTPVVLGPGRISLQLSTEVSQLSSTGALTATTTSTATCTNASSSPSDCTTQATTTIPALTVRRAETTVELPSGGSFAIAGLMQHNTTQNINGVPGLKDLPVLGALFRSREFQNDETELVVMVTAYLVKPVAPGNLASPTDGFVNPSEAEALLLNKLNANSDPAKNKDKATSDKASDASKGADKAKDKDNVGYIVP